MTEFSGSIPIGGVKVLVELDDAPYQKSLSNFKSRISKNEGMPRLMAPSAAQQAYAARFGGSDVSGGDTSTLPGGRAIANWGTPGSGRGANQRSSAGGASSGSAGPSRPGFLNRNIGFSSGHSLLSLYAFSRSAEAMENFTSEAIQAARNLKAAVNDTGTIRAVVQGRRAAESAAAQVPLAGGLGIATRRLFDSITGNSPDDIDRETAETERDRTFANENYSRDFARRAKNAGIYASTFYAGGSLAANLKAVEARRRMTQARIADEADERLRQYQIQDRPDPNDFKKYGLFGASNPAYQQDLKDWQSKDQQIQNSRRSIHAGRTADIKSNNADAEAEAGRLKFESTQLGFELKMREESAKLAQKRQLIESEIVNKLIEYKRQFDAVQVEKKPQFLSTAAEELKADRQNMIMDVMRTPARVVDTSRNYFGDPAGRLGFENPLEVNRRMILLMEQQTRYQKNMSDDTGRPWIMGR